MTSARAYNRLIRTIAGIGGQPTDSQDTRLQKSLLVFSSLMMASLAILWAAVYFAFREYLAAAIPFTYAVLSFISLGWFARSRRYAFFRASQLLLPLLLPFFLMLELGGFVNSGAVILWSITSPLGAMLFAGRRQALGWFLAYLALVVLGAIVQPLPRPGASLPPALLIVFFVTNIGFVSIVIFILLQYFMSQKEATLRLLDIERAKSERLLLNILPAEIAAILKNEERVIADHFEQASILFADMVGFTPLTARMEPGEMVILLNEIFSHFDSLVEKYGLEKIRTIGDSYMVASGVPRPRPDHAQALARMALDIQAYISGDPHCEERHLSFRIGISSGPVVAGVIGRRKFIYDLWGDAVNTASRMESHGLPGQIQISRETFELLKDDFICERRGEVMVKGKGEMETWILISPRDATSVQALNGDSNGS